MLLNPKNYTLKHKDQRYQEIIEKTIAFFENSLIWKKLREI